MRPYFADSWYFLALLNEFDESHEDVSTFSLSLDRGIVTTDWILVEVGDALSAPNYRRRYEPFFRELRSSRRFTILSETRKHLLAGTTLYSERPDKAWSLTDCISFTVMQRLRMVEALTADRHFEQAGFQAVFKR